MTKLKPCLFCGGRSFRLVNWYVWQWKQCRDCGTSKRIGLAKPKARKVKR